MRALCLVTAFGLLVLAACGGSGGPGGSGGAEYPVVTDPPVEHGETITGPSGAETSKPLKPKILVAEPSQTCERRSLKGSPTQDFLVVPPRPGLKARAISERTIELTWWFEEVPDDCRPATMLLSIVANDAPGATPTTVPAAFTGANGAARITYPDFLPPPDVALASAVTLTGRRSGTARA